MAKYELTDEVKEKLDSLTKDELIAKIGNFSNDLKAETSNYKKDETIKEVNNRLKNLKEPYKYRIRELNAYISYIIDIIPNK